MKTNRKTGQYLISFRGEMEIRPNMSDYIKIKPVTKTKEDEGEFFFKAQYMIISKV